jgi:hypothetical protein
MKQLHVLMVSEYFHPHGKGGGEMSALALAEALVGKGVKVSVLTSRFPKDKEKDSVNGAGSPLVKTQRHLRAISAA